MSQTTVPVIPGYLKQQTVGPHGAFTQQAGAMAAFPSISDIPNNIPLLNIPNLSPEQQALIQKILGESGGSPEMSAAAAQIAQLAGGPIGQSPDTLAAMKAYREQVEPQVMQHAALMGRGTGGAALEAVQQGETQAYVPLVQQEIQNRETAVGQYQQQAQAQMQALQSALEAAGVPREVAQEQAQAAFQQLMAKVGFEQQIQTMPLGLEALGQKNYQTMGWQDWVGGVGKSLSLSGIFGGGGKE